MFYEAGAKAALLSVGLHKIAARIPAIHGTFEQFPKLIPSVSKKNLLTDPNAAALYFATRKRGALPAISNFAERAVKQQGKGSPVIAHTNLDTREGWGPAGLTLAAKKDGLELPDAHDLVRSLDAPGLSRTDRGPIWRDIHKYVGSWRNRDFSTTVTPSHYTDVPAKLT